MSIYSPEDEAILEGESWIVLQTRSGQEFALEHDIARAGFCAYVPRHITERPRPGWRNHAVEIVRPLFASYAFVLGDGRAAARFVSCDFNTSQRHVKRLPSLMRQRGMDKIRQAEEKAQQERWAKWSPGVSAIIQAACDAITAGLPREEYMNLGDLQALAS